MTALTTICDVLVIGGGPAGMAAALAARESGCKDVLILEREAELGGILRQCIHTGFGLHIFKEELTGPEYAARYVEQVKEAGIAYQCDTMVISLSAERVATCVSPSHGLQRIEARAVVLAMGCRERPRGAIGIPGTRCAGILSAGTAQRFVNLEGYMPGKQVVIVGSGDIGLIMARRMTFSGAKVEAVVELMPFSSGLKRNVVQCLHDYDIPLLLSHTVTAIRGKERVTGVTVNQVDANLRPIPGTERDFACDTLLLSVGLIPENELSRAAGLELDPMTTGPVVDDRLECSVPGIFACGNVLHVHDLVDNVSMEAERAGQQAAAHAAAKRDGTGDHTGCQCAPIAVRDGAGVRGLVPRRVSAEALRQGPLTLTFRPDRVYRNAVLLVEADGVVVNRLRKRVIVPGEMVELTIKPEFFLETFPKQEISVRVEAEEGRIGAKA
ncbi:MAG: FAD-dependent oxidoreductase [Lentisphaeria bacterium]|nr:FAD-dependent oxidoreductase [Lentisphaeria bacterium]